ncbi:MAG: Hsp20/alpha crystallin family protein [Firmicutes bacterium]|nr:Hsp20/alpha crystallin family protein [Bacillota bacterium]
MLGQYAFARELFDEIADSAFGNRNTTGLMNMDIRQTDTGYEMFIDLPGVQKEDLSIELKDGYLYISATLKNDEKSDGTSYRYLRRERFVGTVRRAFYVGDNVTQSDIHARFQDGTLHLTIDRKQQQTLIENKQLIAIED